MNETFDIKKLSDVEIKALAYDELAKVELAQNNLRVLNQELAVRAAEAAKKNSKD
jgi:hypothetical protein